MNFFYSISWDAFGSGYFWSLLLLQCLFHWLYILGIPVDLLKAADEKILDPYLMLQLRRRSPVLDWSQFILIVITTSFGTVLLILGFWFQLTLFQGLSLLICPQIIIFFISDRTTKNILAFDYGFVEKIILIKKLHLMVQLLSIFTILSASVLSFRHVIH